MDHLKIPILNITNSQPHPTRHNYVLYYFKKEEEANYFEEQLKKGGFFYETDEQEYKEMPIYVFGVRTSDQDRIDIINYTTKGMFRDPMIKDPVIRNIVIGFGLVVILIAIVGAIMGS